MKKLSVALIGAVIVGTLSTAWAAGDPIVTRQKLMKANGASAKVAGAMMKGERPFDADEAAAVLAGMNAIAYAFGAFFPEGSGPADNTKASAKIWEDMGGFEAALAKYQADTDAAVAAKPADLDAFKAVAGPVFGNCKSCHEAYRISSN